MNSDTKRTRGISAAFGELGVNFPLCVSTGVLYGTMVFGEAYIVFASSIGEYLRPKSAAEGSSMALKLRCYKAVAAGHAFYVPPPLVMPNKAQLTQLRVLRAFKLLIGVGAAGVVGVNTIMAYRQGVQTFEQQVLDGCSPNVNMGANSPYMIRYTKLNECKDESTDKMKASLVLRYGSMQDVTTMLQASSGGNNGSGIGEGCVALPVLLRERENKHAGNKKALHLAVRNACRGLNEGCYVLQDLLSTLPAVPRNGSRIIVQAGGFTRSIDRGRMNTLVSTDRAAKELQETTGADVHMVLLWDVDDGSADYKYHHLDGGTKGDGNWTTKAVQSRDATSDQYGAIVIDARMAVLCEVMQWVDDRHQMMVGDKAGNMKDMLATSSVSAKEGTRRKRKSRKEEGDKNPDRTIPPTEVKSMGQKDGDGDEWIVVERLGTHARILLVSSWQLATNLWSRLDDFLHTISSSALDLVTVKLPTVFLLHAESGTRIVRGTFASITKSLQSWGNTITASLVPKTNGQVQHMRRSVLLDLGPMSSSIHRIFFFPWVAHLFGGKGLREVNPLGQALFQGLRRASVPVALWSGPASAAPPLISGADTIPPLVLIHHTGTRGHATAHAAAVEFTKKGYECCIIRDDGSTFSTLTDAPPPTGTTVIDTQHVAHKVWTYATLRLASGCSAKETADGIRQDIRDRFDTPRQRSSTFFKNGQ